MTELVARRVTARGRVQGVGFRAATRRAAQQSGVRGWVRNEPDGSVLAHLEGPSPAVERVIDAMRAGPVHAAVTGVDVEPDDVEQHPGFAIR